MRAPPYDPGVDLRQRRLVERVHALGAAPMLHLLREIEAGADLTAALQRYAALDAEFIRQLGGDRFAPVIRAVFDGEAA